MPKHLSSAGIAKSTMGPMFGSSNGLPQKVARQERVPDSLAGNYDALTPASTGQGDNSLSAKVHGTDAAKHIYGNGEAPQMPPVVTQPAVVSEKNFVEKPVRAFPGSNKGATHMIL